MRVSKRVRERIRMRERRQIVIKGEKEHDGEMVTKIIRSNDVAVVS